MVFGFGRAAARGPSPQELGVPEMLQREVSRVLAGNALALAKAPKRDRRIGSVAVRDIPAAALEMAGPILNAPNTAIGLTYGGLGHAVGKVRGTNPRIVRGGGTTEYVNNPFGYQGAITIGDTTTYGQDPDDPNDVWADYQKNNGHTIREHERQHMLQGRQLGPLYLPSNALGGLGALIRDRTDKGRPDWHGPSNWNERGPQMRTPRPWPPRRPR